MYVQKSSFLSVWCDMRRNRLVVSKGKACRSVLLCVGRFRLDFREPYYASYTVKEKEKRARIADAN